MLQLRNTLLAAVLIACMATPASAQREQVKELLRDLIESQLRRDQRRRPSRTNLAPGTTAPGGRMTAEQRRKLTQLRPLANQYVNASARLFNGMNDDLRAAPGLRTLMPRALQLNASASAFAQGLDQNPTEDYLLSSLRQLDQQHRQLGFQINQIQPLPPNCRRCLTELDGLRDRVDRLYGVEPQINLQGIDELSGALTVTLDALIEDVSVELRSNSGWRTLVQDGRNLQTQCRSFRFTCGQADGRDALVNEFRGYMKLWNPYADRLESFNNPYLARQIRRAHDLNRQISQQLLIPVGTDKTRARHLAELIDDEFKSLCGFINLNVLATVPNAQALPALTTELKVQTKGFCECITNNESPAQMRRRWQELYATWTKFSYELEPIRNKRIRTIAQEIDASMLALRDVLGIVPTFDRAQIARYSSTADSLAIQMGSLVDRWARREATGRAVQADLRNFRNVCRDFRSSVLDRTAPQALLASCDQLVTQWRRLHPQINRCNGPEAIALDRLADQMTLSLVQLETLLQ